MTIRLQSSIGKGVAGTNGTNGTDGVTFVTWLVFAADEFGGNFSFSPQPANRYMATKAFFIGYTPYPNDFDGLWGQYMP